MSNEPNPTTEQQHRVANGVLYQRRDGYLAARRSNKDAGAQFYFSDFDWIRGYRTLCWVDWQRRTRRADSRNDCKATNVSVSGQGSGVSNFTITSVGRFSGQIGITCIGPDPNEVLAIVPICTQAVLYYALSANGTISGTVPFTPPASITSTSGNAAPPVRGSPVKSLLKPAMLAGTFAGICLAGLRLQKRRSFRSSLILVAMAGLAASVGMTACIGHSGLVMTPGTYSYMVEAAPKSGAATVSTTIKVTVQNS